MNHTPLHIISSMEIDEAEQMAKVCIESGANPNEKDNFGRTPLHFASGTENTSLVNYFITQTSADINAMTDAGETPLMKAICMGKHDNVELLLNNNVDTLISSFTGENAWSLAEKSKNSQIIRKLQEYKEKIDNEEVKKLG